MTKIANTLSILFQPLLSGFYCFILLAYTTDYLSAYTPIGRGVFLGIIILFTIIIPWSIMLISHKRGNISNLDISERKERTPIYLATITSMLLGDYLIFRLLGDYIFSYFMIFAIFAIAIITFINLFWKISSHACGMGIVCGFIMYLALLFSYDYVYIFCLFVILSGAVVASRLYLGKHTYGQVLAGFSLGFLPVICIMFL